MVVGAAHLLGPDGLPAHLRAAEGIDSVLAAENNVDPVVETVGSFRLHKAVADAMVLIGTLNGLISLDKPFSLVKQEPGKAAAIVYAVLEGLRIAAHLLEPVMPETAREILRRIGWTDGLLTLQQLAWGQLQPGSALVDGPSLFPKRELPPAEVPVSIAQPIVATSETPVVAPSVAQSVAAFKPALDIEQFGLADLRVGRVLHCEPVPKSSKLLRLQVDLGEGQPRQILSGIAESFAPDDLIGQQLLVLANLPPRKMMGLESHGMVLVTEDEAGKRVLMQPARAVPVGGTVR